MGWEAWKEECPHEWGRPRGHPSLKGYATARRRRRDGLVFRWGGFRTEQGPYGDRGVGAGGDEGGVGRGDFRLEEGGESATAVPGADGAGDAVYGGGGAGGPSDAMARVGRPVPPGGGWHGGGQAGSGSTAEGAARLRGDAGEHHQRPEANGGRGVLRGSEAGFDSGTTGAAATQSAADRGRIGVRSGPAEGDGGDAGEDHALRPRAVRGVARRDARRRGVRGSAGMLECAECVPERSGGRGAGVDEPAPSGRGAELSKEAEVRESGEGTITKDSLVSRYCSGG